jgi:hypothetical protein
LDHDLYESGLTSLLDQKFRVLAVPAMFVIERVLDGVEEG